MLQLGRGYGEILWEGEWGSQLTLIINEQSHNTRLISSEYLVQTRFQLNTVWDVMVCALHYGRKLWACFVSDTAERVRNKKDKEHHEGIFTPSKHSSIQWSRHFHIEIVLLLIPRCAEVC